MLPLSSSHSCPSPVPRHSGEVPCAPRSPARADYRDAMARLGAAVNVITTDGPAGRAGFTASAVCSVTDEPPTLLICLNRQASVYPIFQTNGVLCVNVLAGAQQSLSALFGGKTPMADRFAAAQWSGSATGSPMLRGAAATFDCRVTQVTAVGTHDVLFCEVQAIGVASDAQALIYFDRRYHSLA